MAFADTSTYTLAYAEEAEFDTPLTGQTGVYALLRNTGESLNTSLESARSDEIDSSRQYTGSVHVSGASGGSVNFQLSYGEYDFALEAVLQSSDWTAAYSDSGTDIDVAGVITGISDTTGLIVGQSVQIAGLTATAENGIHAISAVGTGTITLVGAFTAETVGMTIVADGHILNGSEGRSFTFEKNFEVDGTANYFSMSGMRAGSMSMSFATGSIISGEIAFQGATGVATATTSNDSAYIAAGTTELMNGVSNVTDIALDAVAVNGTLTAITGATFQELSLSINNNLREQAAVGNLFPAGIGSGRIEIESTATLYFANQQFFDQFIVNGSVQLRFNLQDNAGNTYAIMLPELKIASHEVTASGADSDVMASVTFSGIKDARSDTSASIIITRIDA
jgi:hypothetical protein